MFQVRIHGRGGQGVVTAADLLSIAAFAEGRFSLAFPSFGSERMGAPVVSFVRIADSPIRSHEPVTAPDALIVQDATLLHQVDVLSGLPPEGFCLINSERDIGELGLGDVLHLPGRWVTVPATELARAHVGRPVPNVVLLGGFAALTGAVSLGSVLTAVRERFAGRLGDTNAAAAEEAFALVRERLEIAKEGAVRAATG